MKNKEQQDSIVTTIRLPIEVHSELKEAARIAGHPMNAEIVARLSAPSGQTLRDIWRQNETTQQMIQQIIDAISPRR